MFLGGLFKELIDHGLLRRRQIVVVGHLLSGICSETSVNNDKDQNVLNCALQCIETHAHEGVNPNLSSTQLNIILNHATCNSARRQKPVAVDRMSAAVKPGVTGDAPGPKVQILVLTEIF
jgi:hypothetical protein